MAAVRAAGPDCALRRLTALGAGGGDPHLLELDCGGERERVVVHRPAAQSGSTAALLVALAAAGVRVPAPVAVVEGGRLVTRHVDGRPGDGLCAGELAEGLAAALVRVHSAPLDAGWPALPDLGARVRRLIQRRPDDPDERLGETWLRDLLRSLAPPPATRPGPVHGDFWPGNTIWRDGEVVAVIDWEDAAVGDPLSDVANCRLELAMLCGGEAPEAFTRAYRGLRPECDMAGLAWWDLATALRPCGKMSGWGRTARELTVFRERHRGFVERAAHALGAGPC